MPQYMFYAHPKHSPGSRSLQWRRLPVLPVLWQGNARHLFELRRSLDADKLLHNGIEGRPCSWLSRDAIVKGAGKPMLDESTIRISSTHRVERRLLAFSSQIIFRPCFEYPCTDTAPNRGMVRRRRHILIVIPWFAVFEWKQ